MGGSQISGKNKQKLETKIELLKQQGVIIVAASGHLPLPFSRFGTSKIPLGWVEPTYLGGSINTLGVSGSTFDDPLWIASFGGAGITNTAPSREVWVATDFRESHRFDRPPAFYTYQSEGTSYATANTAGILALWSSYHGEEKLKQYDPYRFEVFLNVLKESNKGIERKHGRNLVGYGDINLKRILNVKLLAIDNRKKFEFRMAKEKIINRIVSSSKLLKNYDNLGCLEKNIEKYLSSENLKKNLNQIVNLRANLKDKKMRK